MSQLPYTLYRACDVRELDRVAIEEFGTPGIELMNRAGNAVFSQLLRRWPDARKIGVVCGAGNNGGDGYVVARLAQAQGLAVSLFALSDPEKLKGDARTAWQAAGVQVSGFDAGELINCDVIVDAIFGTGLDRQVEGHWADAIDAINDSGVPVLAVDIPSGLHADSGVVLGHAIQAQATISFIGLKQGLFTAVAVDHCGEIQFDDLGVSAEVYQRVVPSCRRVDWAALKQLLPSRPGSSHKGIFGHTLVIGGNHGMAGAVCLAAEAAMRSGSGLTSVATRPQHVAAMAAARPEVMWHGVSGAADLRPLLHRATVIAIGPGLGQDDWARSMFETALQCNKPIVVDADALNLLAQDPFQRENWVLTPHPGEAARLLVCASDEISQQRFEAVKKIAAKFNATVVLKGAGSLVCSENEDISLCSDGNPGMAVGGMGDALTGIIAALLAQGIEFNTAVSMGVSLHAAAGDRVAENGLRGMTAGDVISVLRLLIN